MAAYRSHTTLAAATRTNSVFTKPSGLATGDLLRIALDIETVTTVTPPTGWFLGAFVDHSAQVNYAYVWWKIATAADVAAASFTITHASAWTNGYCSATSGVSASVVPKFATAQGTGTSATGSALTTVGADAHVELDVITFGDAGALTPPTNFTERYESANNVYVADRTQTTAGSTGSPAVTFGASQAWIVVTTVVEDVAQVSTFPYVAGWSSEVGTSLGSANAQPSPDGAASGDLAVTFVAVDATSSTAITASTGWSKTADAGTTALRSAVVARVLDGTGSDTLSLTGAAQDYAALHLIIRGHNVTSGTIATWLTDLASSATATSTTADPPSQTAAASADHLWLAAAAIDATATGDVISAVPTSYTDIAGQLKSAASTTSTVLRAAYRQAAAATENPGTFTNTSRLWQAWTVGVAPAPTGGTSYAISATGTGTSTGSLAAQASVPISSTGTGTSTGSAAIARTTTATATGTGATAGSLAAQLSIPIAATGTGTSTGSLAIGISSGPASFALSATGNTHSTSGTAAITRTTTASSTGTGTTTGSAAITRTTTATASGTGTSAGSLAVAATLAASATGTGTTTGSAAIARTTGLSATGIGTTAGSLAVEIQPPGPADYSLTATGNTHSTAGTITVIGTMAAGATGTGATAGSATIAALRPIAATGTSTTVGSAVIGAVLTFTASGVTISAGSVVVTNPSDQIPGSASASLVGPSASATLTGPLASASVDLHAASAALAGPAATAVVFAPSARALVEA